MNNPWSVLVVLLLRNPHFLEGRQTGEDKSSNPGTVVAFGYGNGSHYHGVGRKKGELFGYAVGKAREPGCSTNEDD